MTNSLSITSHQRSVMIDLFSVKFVTDIPLDFIMSPKIKEYRKNGDF